MKLLITKKYLTFPVSLKSVKKKVCFYEDEKLIFDLDIHLDMLNPDFTAFENVERFIGKKVTITVTPEMNFSVGESDEMDLPGLWQESYRPQIHYSVPNGYNNDPNGLVYLDGTYHMFYQHNPCSTAWGNMHWGHAVSRDLVHWETKGIALFPDETGTMYSGSAVIDKDNILGLKEGDTPVMLLFYTAAGGKNKLSEGKKATQCLAYSTDNGVTFHKYAGNPVVGHIDACNRDPKVVFVPEIGKYIMALFIKENRYQMLSSEDFVHWQFFDEIEMENDGECPDLYALDCDGKKIWVFEGAHGVYVTGHFEKGHFIIDGAEKNLTYGKGTYAAQSYSNTPDGSAIRIFWDKMRIPGRRFATQMGIPVKMHLEKHFGSIYLAALPVESVKTLRDGIVEESALVLNSEKAYEVGAKPLDIEIKADFDEETVLSIGLFGHTLTVDMTQNLITVSSDPNLRMPVSMDRKKLDLRIIADASCLDLYADNGKFVGATAMICDYNIPRVTVSSCKPIKFEKFACYTMQSIHS